MIDLQALVLAPVYSTWGVPATITPLQGLPFNVSVIDRTSGVEVGGNIDVATIQPAAMVRVSEIESLHVPRAGLRRASIEMNGKSWRIENAMPRPTPGGESDGELMLLLIQPVTPPPPPPPEEPEGDDE
jgi:hypothetical protein